MEIIRSIFKNTTILALGQLITKSFQIVYIAVLARYVLAEGIGIITISISISAMAFVFVNLGFSTLITRDVAVDRNSTALYMVSVNTIKLILGVGAIIIIYVISKAYSPETRVIIMMYAFLTMLGSIYSTFSAVCQGHEKMAYDVVLQLGRDMLNIGLSLLAIYFKASLVVIVGVSLFATTIQLFFVLPLLRSLKVPLFVRLGIAELRRIILLSLPFTALVLVSVVGNNLATIILSRYVDKQEMGLYGAALNLYGTLVIIPTVLSTAIFPVFARLSSDSSNKISIVFQKSFELFLIIEFPLVSLNILMAKQTVELIYGASFLGAVPVFQLLTLSLLGITGYACGNYLIASGRQTFYAKSLSVFTSIQVIFVIILVPHFGIIGSAICIVIMSFLGFVYYSFVSYRFASLRIPWVLFGKVILTTALVTIGALYFLKLGLNFVLVGIIAVLFYLVLVVVFRLIPYEELLIIWRALSFRFKLHNALDMNK